MDARWWPIDRGRDAMMPPCNIISGRSTPEIILSTKCLLFLKQFCKKGGNLNCSRYSQVSF